MTVVPALIFYKEYKLSQDLQEITDANEPVVKNVITKTIETRAISIMKHALKIKIKNVELIRKVELMLPVFVCGGFLFFISTWFLWYCFFLVWNINV